MVLKIYNTLTRKKEVFKPINKREVRVYSCGPTVYWYQHVGNMRAYLFADLLKRTLLYDGYKVKHVINITDVGHLTSDADEGEDKIEKAAKKEKKSAKEVAEYYFSVFNNDLKKLNVLQPNVWSKATEHIKEQIELIKRLEKKGYTYRTSDGIYFDTSKLKDYGKLGKIKVEKLEAGKRVSMGEKRNATDFALWKFSPENEKRQQEWDSLFGTGFPGWHIECSAMSMRYLGEHFDIHTGGEDHIQVHHTNEIAQSESATGKKFVNYWMHNAFLTKDGEKISKSKGGLYTISELEEKGFDPLSYRYFTFTAHYRRPLNFSLEALKDAQNSYERLKNIIVEIKDDKKINKKYLKQFENAINNDLDMPNAISALWNMVRDNKAEGKLKAIKEMDFVLGLDLLKKDNIPKEILGLAKERDRLRKEKKWDEADKIREKLKKKGYVVEDKEKGFNVKKL